jgi:hypothetical protein
MAGLSKQKREFRQEFERARMEDDSSRAFLPWKARGIKQFAGRFTPSGPFPANWSRHAVNGKGRTFSPAFYLIAYLLENRL